MKAIHLVLSAALAATASGSDSVVVADADGGAVELLRRAKTAYSQGRYTEVVELTSALIERTGPSPQAYRLRAEAYGPLRHFDRAVADLDRSIELEPDAGGDYQTRGEMHFKAGHIRQSIADFDRFLELRPKRKPHHWQRGISYYYAGEYQKGLRQFELHKKVNPRDVENAVWHYLCNAKLSGPDKARAALIEITGDGRPWAMTVYRMYQGKVTTRQALAHADRIGDTPTQRRNNLFYTHLYVGLYYQSMGRAERALEHIRISAEEYSSPHYMGDVARVALQLFQVKPEVPVDHGRVIVQPHLHVGRRTGRRAVGPVYPAEIVRLAVLDQKRPAD